MGKVIDIKNRLIKKWKEDKTWYREGKEAMDAVGDRYADAIISFTLHCVELDCEIGLSIGDYADEEFIDIDTPIFNEIDNMYRDAAAGCYFCDNSIDPNADEFNQDTKMCLICQLKAGNLLTACGFDPCNLFPILVMPRNIQKTRINL